MIKTIFISALLAKLMAQQQPQGICLTEQSNCQNQANTGCLSSFTTDKWDSSNFQIEDLTKHRVCACETAKTFATW
jgi:hypothetical protein